MSFMPRMTAQTRAIRTLRPLSWRRWPGVIADVWHVHGKAGGGGFYSSPDPRLVVFLGPRAELRLRTEECADWAEGIGVFFIPAQMPLWSELTQDGAYAHLDLHLDAGPLAQRLTGLAADLRRPQLLTGSEKIAALADLLAEEVQRPARPDIMGDGLVSALLSEVLALSAPLPEPERGGLSPHMIQKLESHVHNHLHRRIPVAELAELAGLSESWLTRAFRQSLGTPPQRWLMAERLNAAQAMMSDPARGLAEIAAATGFADQAHLTRSFRTRFGQTPGDWRRQRFVPDSTNHAGTVQASALIPR